MDIALVFPGCHRRGGVERSVYEAARHLSRAHDVTVYAQEFEEGGLEGVRQVRIATATVPKALRLAAFARGVRAELSTRRHDHVISFGVGDVDADVLWVNSVHRAWLERRDVFSGDRLRSSPIRRYLPRHQVLLAMERRYFSRPRRSLVVVVADRVGEDLHRLYAMDPERTVTIHNGFDPAEFHPGNHVGRDAVRAELGIPRDAVVLLLVANELPRKGLPVLLDAVAGLDDPRVHVLLVGRTAPDSYRARADQLGLAGRFHYAGSRPDMGRIHGASDLFVLPTRYEAFCLAIVESLASGLPVITTNVPGAGDLVIDGVNGALQQDPLSATELTGLLSKALQHDRYLTWAAAAPETVADHTWSRLFERALEHLMALSTRSTEPR